MRWTSTCWRSGPLRPDPTRSCGPPVWTRPTGTAKSAAADDPRLSSPFGGDRRDGGVRPLSAFAGPLQALDLHEAGSRQPLGELVNGPAIGGHDLVVEGG